MPGAGPAAALHAARVALARSAGLSAFLYGYPLLEMLRTCRVQARAEHEAGTRPLANQLLHWAGPTQAEDRDVVTPANDLMYTTAWLHLAEGPVRLQVPAAARHPGRYFVLALYDAYTENFCNLGPANCAPEGEAVWLRGPGPQAGAAPPPGARVIDCPTALVWLLARVLVRDEADLPAARHLQAEIELTAASHALPEAVAQWQGEPADPVAAVAERGQAPQAVAEAFFSHLCRALALAPGRVEDAGLIASWRPAGLAPGAGFAWAGLEAAQREGLAAGLQDAVHLLAQQAGARQVRPWVMSPQNGRYGLNYLARAVVAYIGLGALRADEALYAAGHFDAEGQPLLGEAGYTLRFAPSEEPPARAFWSVTLYSADRYLFPNPLRRHALGSRSAGLQRDADGGLTLHISHRAPAQASNWLPAPPGRFYLVLRLYHPSEDARAWRIPALQRNPA